MVGDLESLTLKKRMGDSDETHTPYAGGYMMIDTERALDEEDIAVFYSEDHKVYEEDFEKRSSMMLSQMIRRIIHDATKARKALVMYFHNLAGL